MRDWPHRTNDDGSPSWWTGEEEAGAEFMQLLNRKGSSAQTVAAPADPIANAIDADVAAHPT